MHTMHVHPKQRATFAEHGRTAYFFLRMSIMPFETISKQCRQIIFKLSSNREASENNHHSANKNKGSKNRKDTKLGLVIGKMLLPLGWYPSCLTPEGAL